MTNKEAQQVLDELQGVRPEMLNGEAKRLYEGIMKIADEKDELKQKLKEANKGTNSLMQSRRKWKHRYYKMKNKNKEQDKIIDLIAEMLNNHKISDDICKQMGQKEDCDDYADKERCKACIKQFFENKVKEIDHKRKNKYK